MSKSIFYLIVILFFLNSCKKDNYYSSDILEVYDEFIENMSLGCPEEKSDYYFRGIIYGIQTCYYDGVDGRRITVGFGSSFETETPLFVTGDKVSNVKKVIDISFLPYPINSKKEFLVITFPYFTVERSYVEYLDSLFAIKKHEVKSDLDGGIMDESYSKFEIVLKMVDESGHGYPISTIYGSQKDSYMEIHNVKKTIEHGNIYYYVEMNFECNLYHNPLFKKDGFWSRIENGEIVVKFSIPDE